MRYEYDNKLGEQSNFYIINLKYLHSKIANNVANQK